MNPDVISAPVTKPQLRLEHWQTNPFLEHDMLTGSLDNTVIVAYTLPADEMVGCISLSIHEDSAEERGGSETEKSAWINHIYVKPATRRCGIGRALVAAAVGWMNERTGLLKRQNLYVGPMCESANYLRRLGFVDIVDRDEHEEVTQTRDSDHMDITRLESRNDCGYLLALPLAETLDRETRCDPPSMRVVEYSGGNTTSADDDESEMRFPSWVLEYVETVKQATSVLGRTFVTMEKLGSLQHERAVAVATILEGVGGDASRQIILTEPLSHRVGGASKLVEAAKTYARSRSMTDILLITRPWNVQFYTKLGFTTFSGMVMKLELTE